MSKQKALKGFIFGTFATDRAELASCATGPPQDVEVVCAPPFVYLSEVQGSLRKDPPVDAARHVRGGWVGRPGVGVEVRGWVAAWVYMEAGSSGGVVTVQAASGGFGWFGFDECATGHSFTWRRWIIAEI